MDQFLERHKLLKLMRKQITQIVLNLLKKFNFLVRNFAIKKITGQDVPLESPSKHLREELIPVPAFRSLYLCPLVPFSLLSHTRR